MVTKNQVGYGHDAKLPQTNRWLYGSLWENDPTSFQIYNLSKDISNEFMVSIISFKFSSIQHVVPFVKYGPIKSKIDDMYAQLDG